MITNVDSALYDIGRMLTTISKFEDKSLFSIEDINHSSKAEVLVELLFSADIHFTLNYICGRFHFTCYQFH